MTWNKGKTKDTDPRIKTVGRRKVTDEVKLQKIIYREQCSFNLAGIIQYVDGYEQLVEFGMYDRKTNTDGVVRDHIISVDYWL